MFPLTKQNKTEQQVKTSGKWPTSVYSLKCCCAGTEERKVQSSSLREQDKSNLILVPSDIYSYKATLFCE